MNWNYEVMRCAKKRMQIGKQHIQTRKENLRCSKNLR